MISHASPSNPSVLILVVEDDPLQRLGMIDLVEDAGYGAVEARDADEAVIILEQREDIRVVFTDVDMPGSMDGLRLAAAIRKRWPPIEIIVTSGGHKPALDVLPVRAEFIPKPIVPADAIRLLRAFAA
ncbi:response regulator [Croceicoccus sp. YJ47]|uniref:response regulator n=1 Tax=Croceicoccus sp. YJ47 TaxID=2798724 RepID=UPI00192192FD|nr:response regulator [Croceicoccus sp. YJ47]QQN74726.1 response regulator [Croceicoccus sp. YJ47]